MATSLLIGGEDRESAKRRKKAEYAQDLELQMREKDAARQRERIQGMAVNASGWLDPEKGPNRFKPLGGVNWTEARGKRDERVKPYHTLFLYGRDRSTSPRLSPPTERTRVRVRTRAPYTSGESLYDRSARQQNPPVSVRRLDVDITPRRRVDLGVPPELQYQSVLTSPYQSMDTGGTHYVYQQGGGSIVQPIVIPTGDTRPIIVQNPQPQTVTYRGPRYNPFEQKDDGTARELRNLINQQQRRNLVDNVTKQRRRKTAEKLRRKQLKNSADRDRMRRENEELQLRLRRELEDERKKLSDQEAEARRKLEELRRDAEARRREAEKERLEAERLRKLADANRPHSNPIVRPPSHKTMVYYDMNDYRQRLIDERKKIEALLKSGKPVQEVWNLKVLPKRKIEIPPTPKSADRANRDNVQDFNNLKQRDFNHRDQFRKVYPDNPVTNRRLEEQQEALLRQQEIALKDMPPVRKQGKSPHRSPRRSSRDAPRRRDSRGRGHREDWTTLTPLPHVVRQKDKLYGDLGSDNELDDIHKRAAYRDQYLGNVSSRNDEKLEGLKLRHHRSGSADTLTDDTWLRPSSTAEV